MGSLLKVFFLLGLGVFSVLATHETFDQNTDWKAAKNVYQFHAHDIYGNDVKLDKYKGYVLIIVNVASKCDLTASNYPQLQELYERYKGQGLRILGFPSGDFKNQEFDTSEEILEFVKRYNITFDLYEKVHVLGDKQAHPLWRYLQTRQEGYSLNLIQWNFTKFVVNSEGQVVARFTPHTEPKEMEDTLKLYLHKA